MKLFISDFHIGSSLFDKEKENKIIDLFNRKEITEIYLLGDIIDRFENNTQNIIKNNKRIIDFINNCEKIKYIIKGNHDKDLDKVFYKQKIVDKLVNKDQILMHGHFSKNTIFDKLNFIHSFFSSFDINIKCLFRTFIYNLIKSLFNKKGLILNIEKDIAKYCIKKGFNCVICGHTHIPILTKYEDLIYMNCGSVIDGFNFILINKNKIKLVKNWNYDNLI